ncbi:hypothetical protein [Clostridium sporogenes]|uniref:hypothetical protein n=1 Tax=Clostridium sporogenes TaxID=1509 RepID=UPI0013D1EC3F|nr:hypothetical protein [Clostridium sporogenes]
MSNKELAYWTYKILQQRKRDKLMKKRQDFMMHTISNIDKVYKKNYRGTKRRGQI